MPFYRATPISSSLSHPDWEHSIYHGSCSVVADSLDNAIDFITAKYAIAKKTNDNKNTTRNPWRNLELVDYREIAHTGGSLPPKGVIIVPQN